MQTAVPSQHWERRHVRWFFAGLLVVIGVLDVVGAIGGRPVLRVTWLQGLVPAGVSYGGRTAVVIAGLGLVLLARGLARGKRVAWQLACTVLAASVVLHLIKSFDVESAILAAWLLLGLWWLRGSFQARSDPAALRRGFALLAAALALGLIYAFAGSWILEHELTPSGLSARRTIHHLTGSVIAASQSYTARTARAQWFLDSLPVVAGTLGLVGLLQLLRPLKGMTGERGVEVAKVQDLLRRFGQNPVSWLAASDGFSYFWSEAGCVPYRVSGRVAIALGDPIGPPERLPELIAAFTEHCEGRDLVSSFYQVASPAPYQAAGFTLVRIGSDASIPVSAFSLEGKVKADLRYAVRRCEREGVTFRVMAADQAWEAHGQQLRAVSGAWLRAGKGQEMSFSVGTLANLADPNVTVALAHAADGRLVAFVSWLPLPARDGWALDLMRRVPHAPYGVIEALLVKSIEDAHRRGLREVSLGLAPLALEGVASGPHTAVLKAVYRRLDRFRGSRSLSEFKAKFGPRWEPRYLAVPHVGLLPVVVPALLGVHLPGLRRLALRLPLPDRLSIGRPSRVTG